MPGAARTRFGTRSSRSRRGRRSQWESRAASTASAREECGQPQDHRQDARARPRPAPPRPPPPPERALRRPRPGGDGDEVGNEQQDGEAPGLRVPARRDGGRCEARAGQRRGRALDEKAVARREDPGKEGEGGEVLQVVARTDQVAGQCEGEPAHECGWPSAPEHPGPGEATQGRCQVGEQHPGLETGLEGKGHEERVEGVQDRVDRAGNLRDAQPGEGIPLRDLPGRPARPPPRSSWGGGASPSRGTGTARSR